MQINLLKNGAELTIKLEGRLDFASAPEFENAINEHLDGVDKLIIDLADLEYISSAGLRVMLKAQKIMNSKEMIVVNVNEIVMEVFGITGFCDILTIIE